MNLLPRSTFVLALLGPVLAQAPATTLLDASHGAAVVVRATVLAATDPSPEWHRLSFRTDEVLKGTVGAEFELLEPAGACCGRSLFALLPGQRCLLFLQRTGAVLHPHGGSRGVLADEPATVLAVRQLLTAPDDATRARRLVAQLQHEEPRVAADAAQALATLPSLTLGPSDRTALASALQQALQLRTTRSAPLLDAAVRLHDADLLDQLLPAYLAADRDDQARLLRRGIARAAAATITERLPMFVAGDDLRQLRAAQLLAELPAADALPALQNLLLTTTCPRVKLCTSEALLAGGAQATSLVPFVPAPILDLAQQRHRTARTFRAIQPDQP